MNSSSDSCQCRSADLECALMRETLTPNCVSPTASPSRCFSRPSMTWANSFGYERLLSNGIFERSIFGMTSRLPRRIGLAGLVQIARAGLVALQPHVDVGIDHGVVHGAGADLDIDRVARAAVDQAVADAGIGLPARGVARLEHGFA